MAWTDIFRGLGELRAPAGEMERRGGGGVRYFTHPVRLSEVTQTSLSGWRVLLGFLVRCASSLDVLHHLQELWWGDRERGQSSQSINLPSTSQTEDGDHPVILKFVLMVALSLSSQPTTITGLSYCFLQIMQSEKIIHT